MTEQLLTFTYKETTSQRLDHFLVSQITEISRSQLQGLIKDGYVTVDNIAVTKTGFKLEAGKTISIILPPPKPTDLIPEDIPLNIVYEDSDIIVVNKPPGMVVHPSAGHSSGTLVHAILAHCPDLEGVGGVQRPGIVHRLDKDTSGILVVAKNDASHQFLQKQFKKRQVQKQYLALVESRPPTKSGRIEAAIGRDPKNRQRMAVQPEKKGKMAISEYSTLENFPHHTLLSVKILTGRTHQIRVHLAYLNCPVVGDRVYGNKKVTLPVDRQLLHAHKLRIQWNKNIPEREFTAPLADDFQQTLEQLRKSA
ncbi:RluA family pseudouridine synthase [bacterium]|nr:RluA family pseudouridine synthase [bacterium]